MEALLLFTERLFYFCSNGDAEVKYRCERECARSCQFTSIQTKYAVLGGI